MYVPLIHLEAMIQSRAHLKTTTIGLSLPVKTMRPFHIISADETIIPKLSTWYRN